MTRDEDRSPGNPITTTPGPAARILPFEPGRPGAPAPHAPCRNTRLLADGRCRWHQGPHELTAT